MGSVRLRVADLERQIEFYRDTLGLPVLGEDGGAAALGDGREVLVLEESPGAPPPARRTTGLFHVALLLPSREDLGAALLGLERRGWPRQGYADHAVSEAIYLADPEGNGIELYADRPRERWRSVGDELHITTEPLDLPGLVGAAAGPSDRLPAATVVGHVHLKVSTLEAAEAFYVGRLGFDVTARSYPGALFVSAGGYHHHLGLNVWSGVGAARPQEGSRGLRSFEVAVPDPAARRRLLGDADEGAVHDPDGIEVRIVSAD